MALRKIYFGDFNNENKNKLLDMSTEYLKNNKGANFLYILPNGSLLTSYRKYFLDRVENVMEVNIYTFDDIANRLAKKWNYKTITNKVKEIFLEKIAKDLYDQGRLTYYGNMLDKKGFIKNISDIISQLKSSLIRAEDYFKTSSKDAKFLEIGFIYLEYERLLKENRLMDKEDRFLHTIDGLRDNYRGFLKDIDFIIIDEFYDFRPQEMAIIGEIGKLDIDIHINMPFRREGNFKVIEETIDELMVYGFELERIEKKEKNPFEDLANYIFYKEEALETNDISLIKAPTSHLEVKKLAENIKKEYVRGVGLDEMAVVVTSNKYQPIIEEVFSAETIPTNQSLESKLTSLALVKEVFYLLENRLENTNETLINRIKSNYLPLVAYEDREEIERYIRTNCLKVEDLREKELPKDMEEIINGVVLALDREEEILGEEGTIKSFSLDLLEIIEEYKIEDSLIDTYRKTGDYEIFHRDLLALKQVKDSLSRLGDMDEDLFEIISLVDYVDVVYDYLDEMSVKLMDGNKKGVRILSPAMARGYNYKVIFILGLTQGDYPSLAKENFFFKDDNIQFFREINLEYRDYYERLDKESMNFLIGISQVKERLYLSYSENITDNESGIGSIFLDELLYSLKGEKLEDKLAYEELEMTYNLKKDLASVTSLDDFSYYVLSKEDLDLRDYGRLNSLDRNRLKNIALRSQGEYERYKGLSNYSGIIENKEILKEINASLKDRIYSISYLEGYGKCPYAFMLRKVLKLGEFNRRLEEFTKIDRGNINHLVLQDFYSSHEDKIRDYIFDRAGLNLVKLEDYLLERYKLHQEYRELDSSSPLYSLKRETNVEKIKNYIGLDLDRLKGYKKKVIPIEYEREFGAYKDFYIEESGERIYLRGIIDRIDKFVDEDSYIVMDYKNSPYGLASKEDLDKGISLQIPVYIMSLKERKVVGGFYGVISNGKLEVLILDESERELVARRRSGVYSQEEIEKILKSTRTYIFKYVKGIGAGDFRLDPKECSAYCEYRDICRVREDVDYDK